MPRGTYDLDNAIAEFFRTVKSATMLPADATEGKSGPLLSKG
jgi:hypothetical protein